MGDAISSLHISFTQHFHIVVRTHCRLKFVVLIFTPQTHRHSEDSQFVSHKVQDRNRPKAGFIEQIT